MSFEGRRCAGRGSTSYWAGLRMSLQCQPISQVAQDGYLPFNSSSESVSNEAEKRLDHCFLSAHSSDQENTL